MKRSFKQTMKKALCYLLTAGMITGMAIPAQAEEAVLIAKYDFENASGTTVPNEADGATGFTAALNGSNVSIEEGTVLGKSLKFTDGTEGHMLVEDILNTGTTSYSISMWYKYDTTASRSTKTVLLQQGGGGRTLLTLTPGNQYHTYINTADKFSTGTVDAELWQHVILVNDAVNQTVKFYINGVLDSEQAAGSGAVNELTDLFVGRHKNGGTDPQSMRGLVDEICVYEGMIDDAKALEIYNEKAEIVNAGQPEQTPTPEPEASSVLLTVNPDAVERTLDDSVFGINHRYAFNGYGTYDSYLGEVKDDFVELYEEAGFGSIRYPGGTISNLYNWKTTLDAVGRKNQIHGFYNNAGQGGIEPNFGITEIGDFADQVNSEIVYVYSLGRGSAQDAQDLIEFLNAEVGTNPNGGIDWAAVRAESGHPEPYNVRYFEIGNEMQQAYADYDGTASQGYWLTAVASGAETAYIEGGTAKYTKQYAVCEEDWNATASKSDGSANLVRYMRYANTNPKKYDEAGNIVDDESFVALNKTGVEIYVGSEQWTIVESFADSASDDKHVVIDYSTGAIHFGDGVNGAIPEAGAQIYATYSVEREGFVAVSRAMQETTEAINKANAENGVDTQQEVYIYSSYETSGFITKMKNGGYNDLYDGLTIHPYSGTPDGSGTTFYDSAMLKAENVGVAHVQSYVNMMPEDKVPVISEYGIFRSTDPLVRSQTHAIYIAKVLMEYVRLGSPYIQKHCLTDWYSSGADSLGPTQQAVIQVVAQNGANTKTGEGDFAYFSTPSARVFQMLNSSFGDEVLTSSFNTTEKLSNGVKAYSALASKDAYDNYYVAIVNVDRTAAAEVEIKIDGKNLDGKNVELQMLSSDSYDAENTLEDPDNVAVVTTTYENEGNTLKVEVPKHSFAVVKVSLGVDKTALEAAIEEAKDVNEADYTAESWNLANVAAAVEAAEEVLNNENATDEEVAEALEALEFSMAALTAAEADKAALRAAIAAVDALDQENYTGESWSEMQILYSAACSVEKKANASQELVNKVTADLKAAMSSLKKVIPVSAMTVTAGDSQNGEGPEYVLDGDTATIWHTNWYSGPNHDNHWLQFKLDDTYLVDGLQYLPRQSGANGIITGYEVYVSADGTDWQLAAEGTWTADSSWKSVEFEAIEGSYVKLVTVSAQSDQSVKFASAAEVRLTGYLEGEQPVPEVTITPEVTEAPQPTVTEAPEKEDVTEVFDDVYADWYVNYVQYVYDNGLMTGIKGTNNFEPNANITKAQVAQVLYNMEAQPEVTDKSVFTELKDVYEAEWYANAVAWAFNTGVVTGDLNTKQFNPNANVTREQLALMMYRYAQYKEYDTTASSDLAGLANAENTSNWAMDGVKWAVGEGLISGIDKGTVKDLAPQGNASRAQMAAILQRFCENMK